MAKLNIVFIAAKTIRVSIGALMFLHSAHPSMDAAILFFLLGVKGCDVRKIASSAIGILQNLLT